MLQDTAIQIAAGTVVIPDASRYLQEYSGCDGTCSGTITTGLPVAQHAHFVGATALDLYRTLTANLHNAVLRCAARSTAAVLDRVFEQLIFTLVEQHAFSGPKETSNL